jgi:(2R)-ethylmalonyl-CoA mutase
MAIVAEQGGAVAAVPYMKTQMVESHRARVQRIETGAQKVIGQNCFTEAEPSPLQTGEDGGILRVDPAVEASSIEALAAWREARDEEAASTAIGALHDAAADPEVNIMPATLDAARAGVTTGEWAAALRSVFGEYRAPTGVGDAAAAPTDDALTALRDRVEEVSAALGRRIKILVGKPGLDGHSNGAEQIAVRARDAGMDVVYEGIRLTPARIARTAVDEGVHVVGLSILSGSHAELIPTVLAELREAGVDVPVVVGGIIPPADEEALLEAGVARVYTPKDFEVSRIMGDIVSLVAEHHGVVAVP